MESKKHIFTPLEKKCFMEIIKKYSSVIENRDTDGSSLQRKNECWNRIATEFNASPFALNQATHKQLRRLWTNLKQRQREALTKERQHRLATGGGPATSDVNIDPDIAVVAPALIVGIDNAIDSDTLGDIAVYSPSATSWMNTSSSVSLTPMVKDNSTIDVEVVPQEVQDIEVDIPLLTPIVNSSPSESNFPPPTSSSRPTKTRAVLTKEQIIDIFGM